MADYTRCSENSPYCLGLTEYNCCGKLEKQSSMLQTKRKSSSINFEEIDDNDFEGYLQV